MDDGLRMATFADREGPRLVFRLGLDPVSTNQHDPFFLYGKETLLQNLGDPRTGARGTGIGYGIQALSPAPARAVAVAVSRNTAERKELEKIEFQTFDWGLGGHARASYKSSIVAYC